MKKTLLNTAALISFALLTACGGNNNGVTSVPAPTPAPIPSENTFEDAKPASNSTADILSFIEAGGRDNDNRFDVLSVSRDYDGNTATYDTIKGANGGLLRLTNKDGTETYRITAQENPNIVVGTGSYSGPLNLTYSVEKGGDLTAASGEFNLYVDFENKDAYVGGIVASSENNIEFFADAKINSGKFSSNDTIVRLRDGQGNFIQDYTGTSSGMFVAGANGQDGVVGRVSSEELSLNGAYFANEYIED
jgi:hypothetical protein